MKPERGPAPASRSLRWALSVLVAAALASGGAACSGGGDEPERPPGPLAAALAYLPSSTALVVVLPTARDRGPLRDLERLARRQRAREGALAQLERELARAGLGAGTLDPQLGNPLAVGAGATEEPVGAVEVGNPDDLRRAAQARIDAGGAERVDVSNDGVLAWRARGFAAISDRDLVLAESKQDLEKALDAGEGSDSIAFDERVLAELQRLGEDALVRSVGDAQRMLDRNPAQAASLREIPWVRALGLLSAVARVEKRNIPLEVQLRTDRAPLTDADLPLAPGPRSPDLHDAGATASVGVREPDRLARFLERSAEATNPNGFARYATATGQLRSLFGVDVHRDVLQKMTDASVALASITRLTFVGDLRRGTAGEVEETLRKAGPALDYGLADFLPGTHLVPRGSPPDEWQIRRGRLVVARYGVRDGALVASLGLGGLPSPAGQTRLRGVSGSLVMRGDLRLVGRVLGLLADLPARALEPVSELGDVVLGVQTATSGLEGRGRLELDRR